MEKDCDVQGQSVPPVQCPSPPAHPDSGHELAMSPTASGKMRTVAGLVPPPQPPPQTPPLKPPTQPPSQNSSPYTPTPYPLNLLTSQTTPHLPQIEPSPPIVLWLSISRAVVEPSSPLPRVWAAADPTLFL